MKREITGLYKSRYEGFGPVLFAEKLLIAHEIKVDHETVRRMLVRGCGESRGSGKSGIRRGGRGEAALERWCRWTVRITVGLRIAARCAV